MRLKLKVLSFALAALCIVSTTALFAQEDSFISTIEIGGFAEVKDNNQAIAKAKAIKDAIRKAVEETVESTLPPEVLIDNYSRISGIYSRSEDYIHSYQFLSESYEEETNIYSVTLSITLYPRYIKSLLTSLNLLDININARPKILIIIRERGLLSSNEDNYWEDIPMSELFFVDKLESKGIDVVDRSALQDKVDLELIKKSLKGDVRAAIRAGLLSSAKIVITGNTVARKRGSDPENPGSSIYQANISLKAYHTDTGKLIGARSEFATTSSEDTELGELKAFSAVGEKIYNSFISRIIPENEDT